MEEYKKILVPIDGSELSMKALQKAIRLGKAFGSEITVIHVKEPMDISVGIPGMIGSEVSIQMMLDVTEKEEEKIMVSAKELARKHGTEIGTINRNGHAANEIIDASKDFDLIIMGTHGNSGLVHLMIGSVAEKVARHAYCPVMLIRKKYAPA